MGRFPALILLRRSRNHSSSNSVNPALGLTLTVELEGVAEIGQMTPQIAAGSITEAQFFGQVRMLQTSVLQIRDRFGMAVELRLIKGGGSGEQLGLSGQSGVLLQRPKRAGALLEA
jgi:hypothetical protein